MNSPQSTPVSLGSSDSFVFPIPQFQVVDTIKPKVPIFPPVTKTPEVPKVVVKDMFKRSIKTKFFKEDPKTFFIFPQIETTLKDEVSRLFLQGMDRMRTDHVEYLSRPNSPEPEVIDLTIESVEEVGTLEVDVHTPQVEIYDDLPIFAEPSDNVIVHHILNDYYGYVIPVYFEGTRRSAAGFYPFLVADVIPRSTLIRGFPFERSVDVRNAYVLSTLLIEIDANCAQIYTEPEEVPKMVGGLRVNKNGGGFEEERETNLLQWLEETHQEDHLNKDLLWEDIVAAVALA